MRVLLVEDREDQIAAITSAFEPAAVTFVVAPDRDAALDCIEKNKFDVAICDLRIPSSSGDSVSDVEHGLAVLTAVRERHPGTPIVTFTAYKTKEVLDLLIREQRQEDFLGEMSESPMLRIMEKDELPELIALLDEFLLGVEALEDVEVAVGLGHEPLAWEIERVLRIHARQRGCVVTKVSQLAGGLSGVPVLRVELERADGSSGGSAVARIGRLKTVEAERVLIQQRVSGVLPLGGYAEIVAWVRAGAGDTGAVFYQVAENAVSLWQVIQSDPTRAGDLVSQLATVHERWTSNAPASTARVGDVRSLLIGDQRWEAVRARGGLTPETIEAVEAKDVYVRSGTIHADLHAGNVLVAESPILIDFASVATGPTPLDPVCLELSLLFHPDSPCFGSTWPSADQLRSWSDLDAYLVGCPCPEFVRACRTWATAVARGDRDVVASAYAYVASQCRFETSPTPRLEPLLEGLSAQLVS
jgi:CheY-like chemotaxis protein